MQELNINWTFVMVGGCYLLPSIIFGVILASIYVKHRRKYTVYYCDNYACKKFSNCEYGLNHNLKSLMENYYYFKHLKIDIFDVEKNECKQFKKAK